MPKLTDAELLAAFEEERIGGISPDTNVFDQSECNLEYGLFRRLAQFADTDISVLFTDVVAGEVKAHLTQVLAETSSKLRAALNQFSKKWRLASVEVANVKTIASYERDPAVEASSHWDQFFAHVKGKLVEADDFVTVGEILKRYFEVLPPFGNSSDKKNEFPDACALIALEGWATNAKTLVVIVSKDKGWKEYAEKSKRLVAVDDLRSLYNAFNSKAQEVARQAFSKILAADDTLERHVKDEIREQLNDLDFEVDASSSMNFEIVQNGALLDDIDFGDEPSVIETDAETVTFSVPVTARIEFDAEFSFSVVDNEDFGVSMGSNEVVRTKEVDFELFLTVSRLPENRLELITSELGRKRIRVDFGHVEPDWMPDPEPDQEDPVW